MYSELEIEKARKRHEEKIRERWFFIEKDLIERTTPETGHDICEALKEMHAMLTDGEVISWFANLYDPINGGFYYSNSARDNDGFFPDLESTRQVISFFGSCGMAVEYGNDVPAALPKWVGEGIVRFVKPMQDRNGYFYHPQWSKEETDKHLSRVGRDLDWAVGLLKMFGASPTYDTPNGVKGDGLLCDGSPAENYHETASFCGAAERSADPDVLVKEHLRDKESFIAHLKSFEVDDTVHKNCWHVGNHFESQATMIYDRDKVLRDRGADYSLCDILAEWFTKHQNKENGAWTLTDTIDTSSTNGLLKIASTFNRIKREFPNPIKGIETAITVIKSKTPIPSTCHALNPWYAMNNIVSNVENYNSSPDIESVKEEVARLKRYILDNCAEMIRTSRDKLAVLKMADGSFEYAANGRNGTAQGMPISIQGVHEGNVNAYICTRAVAAHIYALLGYENMPLFGPADRMQFINMLEERRNNALNVN